MIRFLGFCLVLLGAAICIASTLAFFPLLASHAWSLEAVDRITSQGMIAGLVISALGGLVLLASEIVFELRTA